MNAPPARGQVIAYALVLLVATVLVAAVALPLWKPIFMAAVLAATLYGLQTRLSERLGNRPKLAASLVTLGVVLLLLLPFAALATVVIREALTAYSYVREALAQGGLEELAARLPDKIEAPIRDMVDALPVDADRLAEQAAASSRMAAVLLGDALSGFSRLLFSLAMFLVAFYAMLLDGSHLVRWVVRTAPLPAGETRELFDEFRRVSRSVIRSTLLTAIVQGACATVGYLIAGVPQPVFFGVVTFFCAFIPSVGTAVIALPLAGLLLLSGAMGQGIFLAAWAVLVVGLVDNLLKPIIIRGGVEMHGVVIFFSLIGGVIIFGAVGLLVGPLAVSFFLAVIRQGRRDLVDSPPSS